MTVESNKARTIWESELGQRLRENLSMIEDTFTEIRDHKDATPKISGKADFGHGRVADLKGFLYSALEKIS